MIVYRFEDDQGVGPWKGRMCAALIYDNHQKTCDEYHSCSDMPGPYSETGELRQHYRNYGVRGWSFGFSTKDQIKRAFPSSAGRDAMERHGSTSLSVYEADPDHVMRGAAQCIFLKEHAKLIGRLNMKTLKEELT